MQRRFENRVTITSKRHCIFFADFYLSSKIAQKIVREPMLHSINF